MCEYGQFGFEEVTDVVIDGVRFDVVEGGDVCRILQWRVAEPGPNVHLRSVGDEELDPGNLGKRPFEHEEGGRMWVFVIALVEGIYHNHGGVPADRSGPTRSFCIWRWSGSYTTSGLDRRNEIREDRNVGYRCAIWKASVGKVSRRFLRSSTPLEQKNEVPKGPSAGNFSAVVCAMADFPTQRVR